MTNINNYLSSFKSSEFPEIKQIIPAPGDMYATLEELNEDSEKVITYAKIICLALASDGNVHSMVLSDDGRLDFACIAEGFKCVSRSLSQKERGAGNVI